MAQTCWIICPASQPCSTLAFLWNCSPHHSILICPPSWLLVSVFIGYKKIPGNRPENRHQVQAGLIGISLLRNREWSGERVSLSRWMHTIIGYVFSGVVHRSRERQGIKGEKKADSPWGRDRRVRIFMAFIPQILIYFRVWCMITFGFLETLSNKRFPGLS